MSPLWETVAAVRVLIEPGKQAHHLPWLRGLRGELGGLDLAPLVALLPRPGFTPDFLSPPPVGPLASFDEELETLRAVPLEGVARELRQSLYERPGGSHPMAGELLADPASTLERLARTVAAAWSALVRPWWPRLRDLLDADIAYRARRLAEGGLELALADLDTRVSWHGATVSVDVHHSERRDLDGSGLVLMPSAFSWPDIPVRLEPPWQPTLIYPARGVAALWSPPPTDVPAALGRLLGGTRARLLLALDEPASTAALARRFDLSRAGVSEHLTTLRDAGLVAATRNGRQVMYARTALGVALLGPAPAGPS